MLHACCARFDVTENLKKFNKIFWELNKALELDLHFAWRKAMEGGERTREEGGCGWGLEYTCFISLLCWIGWGMDFGWVFIWIWIGE